MKPYQSKTDGAAAVTSTPLLSEWYARLLALAKKIGAEGLISPDPEDHRPGYDDGLTPAEELEEQIDAACR